jgi:predicted esterase
MSASAAVDHATDLAFGPETDAAAAVAVLVHGRGRSAAEMRDLALRLDNPAIRFVMPQAPGATWYPNGFMAPIADNEPALSRSLATCAALVDGLIAAGVRPGDIVLGGFSQGACLTAEFIVRYPRPYGAVVVFTGGLIGPPGTRWPAAPTLRGVPVYLTGSVIDEWVPVARVEETARLLRQNGAAVTLRIFDDRDHRVCDEEIAAARQMLRAWGPAAPRRADGIATN